MPETLPEGWEGSDWGSFYRHDDWSCFRDDYSGKWVLLSPACIPRCPGCIDEGCDEIQGNYDDALTAMLALNAAYPLKGEGNAERD